MCVYCVRVHKLQHNYVQEAKHTGLNPVYVDPNPPTCDRAALSPPPGCSVAGSCCPSADSAAWLAATSKGALVATRPSLVRRSAGELSYCKGSWCDVSSAIPSAPAGKHMR